MKNLKKSKWDLPSSIIWCLIFTIWFGLYTKYDSVIMLLLSILAALMAIFYTYKSTKHK
jgi:hypothetical protein